MGFEDWLPLNKLKRAVKKVRFLLNLDVNRWRIASIIGRTSQRRLSFNDRPGLQAINDDEIDTEEVIGISPRRALQRTISSPSPRSSDEDIDKKADLFIENFYNRLRMERQVSLNLRYCRTDSLESNGSDS
ncbi:uncharacterized protein LOC122659264 [Telopea speciosissima]|uniref:uncharacterized protein LOC122659264 n=1 Tax=Telopea speciosissima TaxID=54955 RepID=UPI001CC4A221|nr:uncharacterized protein LOC122659264 [Telopea speciosissima]